VAPVARSWLGRDAIGAAKPSRAQRDALIDWAESLRQRLRACRLDWLAAQVDAAEAVLTGHEPEGTFFVSGPREQWRDVLAALQALGAGQPAAEQGVDASRIVWAIGMGKDGSLEEIAPFEQKRGPRGFGKAKPLALAKIAGNERLSPWDAKVARAIRRDRYERGWTIDRALAIMALVGHPAVVLADAPEQLSTRRRHARGRGRAKATVTLRVTPRCVPTTAGQRILRRHGRAAKPRHCA
jgi:hypothetical protein